MSTEAVILGIVVVLFGSVATLVARRLFNDCSRHDMCHSGTTPGFLHLRDPYLSAMTDRLYAPRESVQLEEMPCKPNE